MKELVIKQNEEIEIFRKGSPDEVAKMLLDEAIELVEATETAFLTDDLTSVLSEVADVYYLLIRFSSMLGIDLEDALEVKIKRNQLKYFGQTDKAEARRLWEEQGGDKRFFEELD